MGCPSGVRLTGLAPGASYAWPPASASPAVPGGGSTSVVVFLQVPNVSKWRPLRRCLAGSAYRTRPNKPTRTAHPRSMVYVDTEVHPTFRLAFATERNGGALTALQRGPDSTGRTDNAWSSRRPRWRSHEARSEREPRFRRQESLRGGLSAPANVARPQHCVTSPPEKKTRRRIYPAGQTKMNAT